MSIKNKTITQMVMSILLIVDLDGTVINITELVFIYAAIILTVVSLMDYLIKYILLQIHLKHQLHQQEMMQAYHL